MPHDSPGRSLMSQVMRASVALGALALAVAVPGGAAALSAKKPKHTSVVNVVNALPSKTPKNISAKCGKSKSASKIRLRRTSHPTKNRVRTVTTYCNGGTRTVFYIKRTLPAVKTPVPTPVTPAAPAPAPKNFRLTLLHNNDGESKYVVGDSIANYGGIT